VLPSFTQRVGVVLALQLAIIGTIGAETARAEDCYYLVMFAFDKGPLCPKNSHTFAAFVKVSEQKQLEVVTISWLPTTLQVVVLRPHPEPGGNLTLTASLAQAAPNGACITAWGPFQIDGELFDRARCQAARLDSGCVAYIALDCLWRRCGALNCIHAVSDIALDRGCLCTGWAHGRSASRIVLNHLRPWIVCSQQTHDWLKPLLGLNCYPIRYEPFPCCCFSGLLCHPPHLDCSGDR